MSKWVYTFGNGKAEGDASMRNHPHAVKVLTWQK